MAAAIGLGFGFGIGKPIQGRLNSIEFDRNPLVAMPSEIPKLFSDNHAPNCDKNCRMNGATDCDLIRLEEGDSAAATSTSSSSSATTTVASPSSLAPTEPSRNVNREEEEEDDDDDERQSQILVEVEAPATLAGGYVFWATTPSISNERNESRLLSPSHVTFPVRVVSPIRRLEFCSLR